jgi:ubiquinone/menaquinone biosynthesis C-methylase UbiE
MVTAERWNIAQESEKEYWEGFTKNSLLKEEVDRYKKKAEVLQQEWSGYLNLNKNTKILQIGCGPEDVINYLSLGKRYAVDPLADFYKKKFNLDYNGLDLLQARGEELPFPDNSFDIVVLSNVLDHVENPEKVLSEAARILKKGGIFHFEVFTYQKNFIRIAKIWGKIKEITNKEVFNVHHPYMFVKEDAKRLIKKEFTIEKEEFGRSLFDNIQTLEELKSEKKSSKRLTIKIPALFGLYGTINYTAICRK